MKRLARLLLICVVITTATTSCFKKASPEDEVRAFTSHFAQKLALGQIDSVKSTYPEVILAGSFKGLSPDTIIVIPTNTPGKYVVKFAPDVILSVLRSENGDMSIAESRGLFAFPANKVEFAKKTGLWNDSVNDAAMARRLNDQDFVNYVKKTKSVRPKDIITVGRYVSNGNTGYYPVTNNTDVTLRGADYKFIVSSSQVNYISDGYGIDDIVTRTVEEQGMDIAPHQTVQYPADRFYSFVAGPGAPLKKIKNIKFTISESKVQEMFAPYTGNEYSEYLTVKKAMAGAGTAAPRK